MYKQYYGMSHTPFTRDVPPESLYESPAMTDTLGRLAYSADRQLFAVVKKARAKYFKITLENYGKLPDWHISAGEQAWLFVDEIIIQ